MEVDTAIERAIDHLKKHDAPRPFIAGAIDLIPTVKAANRALQPNCDSANGAPFFQATLKHVYDTQARQSAVGMSGGTVVCLRVRKAREVPADELTVGCPAGDWRSAVRRVCDEVASEMSPASEVTADFYKLLLYGDGDFFEAHRDTQRSNDHFASLLIFLPTGYQGGDFILEQTEGFDSATFNEQTQRTLAAKKCRWVAFFSDIPHSVAPVTCGYRLVLTYNLRRRPVAEMVASPQTAGGYLAPPLQAMIDSLHHHFKSLPAKLSDWYHRCYDTESFIIHFEHRYTPSTMGVEHLKGIDSRLYQLLSAHFDVDIRMMSSAQQCGEDADENWGFHTVADQCAAEVTRNAAVGVQVAASTEYNSRRGAYPLPDPEHQDEEEDSLFERIQGERGRKLLYQYPPAFGKGICPATHVWSRAFYRRMHPRFETREHVLGNDYPEWDKVYLSVVMVVKERAPAGQGGGEPSSATNDSMMD